MEDEKLVDMSAIVSQVKGSLKADNAKRSFWKKWFPCCLARKLGPLTTVATEAVDMLRCEDPRGCGGVHAAFCSPGLNRDS